MGTAEMGERLVEEVETGWHSVVEVQVGRELLRRVLSVLNLHL